MPRIDLPDGKSDPEVRMWKLRPEMGIGAGALSHAVYEQSIIPVRERELARMRIAEINDCAICQQWRKTTGSAEALTEDDYAHVGDWRTFAPRASGSRSNTPSGSRSITAPSTTTSSRGYGMPTPTPRSSTSPCASVRGSGSGAR